MTDPYFREFWIVSDKDKKLFPKLIRNMDTGLVRYQLLAKGSNKKMDGDETTDPIVAVRRFLEGDSLRFGSEDETANRFDVDGGHIQSIGMSPALWLRLR
jgi:hypothetical protein